MIASLYPFGKSSPPGKASPGIPGLRVRLASSGAPGRATTGLGQVPLHAGLHTHRFQLATCRSLHARRGETRRAQAPTTPRGRTRRGAGAAHGKVTDRCLHFVPNYSATKLSARSLVQHPAVLCTLLRTYIPGYANRRAVVSSVVPPSSEARPWPGRAPGQSRPPANDLVSLGP